VEAVFKDGPLKGKRVEIDLPDEEGAMLRYCLAEWTQEGMSADYTFVSAV
jgi:hypothetical protein